MKKINGQTRSLNLVVLVVLCAVLLSIAAFVAMLVPRTAAADVVVDPSAPVSGNSLVMTDGSAVKPYDISDAAFGSVATDAVDLPELEYGVLQKDKTRFTLTKKGMTTPIADNIRLDAVAAVGVTGNILSHYINSSMPVGEYSLVFYVDGYMYDVEGGVENYDDFTYSVDFEIVNANIPSSVVSAVKTAVAASSASVNEPIEFSELDDVLSSSTVKRKGIWANEAYDGLYAAAFTITYNIAADNNSVYSEIIAPFTTIGRHHINFDLNAKNYNSLRSNVGKDERAFELDVVAAVDVPWASGVVYTGAEIKPVIELNPLYNIYWLDEDYVSGGAHTVTFVLNTPAHSHWSVASYEADEDFAVKTEGNKTIITHGEKLYATIDGDTVVVNFDISAAENSWIVYPDIIGWGYGHYNNADNRVYATPRFIDAGEAVIFSVSTDRAGANVVEGLESFTIGVDGKIIDASGAIAAALNKLNSGAYYIKANLKESANYGALESRGVRFEVSKIVNDWKKTLSVTAWTEGKYSELDSFPISVESDYGTVLIRVVDVEADDDGKDIVYYDDVFNIEKLGDVLSKLKLGRYVVSARVLDDANGNYTSLYSAPMFLDVFEAPGLAWWAILLIVIGALLLAALVIFILWKNGVFRIITDKIVIGIKTKISVESTIASVRAAKMREEVAKTRAEAKAREEAEERKKKLREASAAQRALPAEEKAAQAEAKAKQAAERAEKMRLRAEAMAARAQRMRERAEVKPEPVDSADITEKKPAKSRKKSVEPETSQESEKDSQSGSELIDTPEQTVEANAEAAAAVDSPIAEEATDIATEANE